ncbi:MAG TPA: DUF4259 domain-containing protein [Caulobacteraceae bacterium]|nr:DUF4259 domain-containing protein [Caulobacteraceae bacterium]
MGASSVDAFDNDDAADFAARLAGAPHWSTIETTLNAALTADYIEAPEASEAVAAAAFVAAAHSGVAGMIPSDHAGLPSVLGPASPALRVLAGEALARVAARSELAELWEESDDGATAWRNTLAAIGARLN